jgi:hypothetical protein
MLLKAPPSSDDATAGPTILEKKKEEIQTPTQFFFCSFSN